MEQKRLVRSQKERMLGGVCGGIAEYFRIDATLVRLLFVVGSFFGGGGVIVYLVMWLIMPEDAAVPPSPPAPPAPPAEGAGKEQGS